LLLLVGKGIHRHLVVVNHFLEGELAERLLKLWTDFVFSMAAADGEGEKVKGLELFLYQ
jgi:hypothetical protein